MTSSNMLQGCSVIILMITHTLYLLYSLCLSSWLYFFKELFSLSLKHEGLQKDF